MDFLFRENSFGSLSVRKIRILLVNRLGISFVRDKIFSAKNIRICIVVILYKPKTIHHDVPLKMINSNYNETPDDDKLFMIYSEIYEFFIFQ